jgi:ketosteroid isomerase-like protein
MTPTETIQELYHSFRVGDYDIFHALCSPAIEWIQSPGFPGGGTWRGPQSIIDNVFKGNASRWDGFGFDIEKYVAEGSSVVVIGHYRGTHRISGKSFTAPTVHVFDVADGLVTRFRQYTDTKVMWDAMP